MYFDLPQKSCLPVLWHSSFKILSSQGVKL
nr:MAG TPA: hypothetical protein [Bacteriophage sp.]